MITIGFFETRECARIPYTDPGVVMIVDASLRDTGADNGEKVRGR
jgi:hypothetical protein